MNWLTVLEALHDGVVIVDAQGIVTYVNEAHCQITGLSRENAVGRFVGEVVPSTSLLEVLLSRAPRLNVVTQVGNKRVISNIVPVMDGNQVVAGVSVFRDVTELSDLSERLQAARDRLSVLHREVAELRLQAGDWVVGTSPAMRRVYDLARRVAAVDSTVLITGESGTGKEVLTRFLHTQGARAQGPFVAVNCAAIPDTLLENELFGHAGGAFTGATKGGQPGLFELAHRGTLLLDEVGDMPAGLQAKVLRVLEEKRVRRIGDRATKAVDVRVIAATNRDLHSMIGNGQFRGDLYYRLSVITIELPPLRDRREDLPLVVQTILNRVTQRLGRAPLALSDAALECLMHHDYPGNVRELGNILEYAAVICPGDTIEAAHLPAALWPWKPPHTTAQLTDTVLDAEKAALVAALTKYSSRTDAARALGISRATLYRRLRKHGLEPT